ncbi:IMD domain containing protein [Sarcoptes scabiei]|uniref:IMD domain containing protein n=1 Tax=Sarcoptes scabiei TaxID=52283 RepID=A0A132AD36_SARSC|nr:IMD domain containing protein [Sarcoptes scabiei]
MESAIMTEQDCNVLGGFFQIIVNDLKNGTSTWDDFLLKATKYQTKPLLPHQRLFWMHFKKSPIWLQPLEVRNYFEIRGTKEIGTALTRLCLRQRSVEAKLKSYASALFDCLILPLQERLEEWKKTTIQLDKERSKELKRLRHELKKRQYSDSLNVTANIRNKKHSSRLNKGNFFENIYGTIGGGHHKSSSSLSKSVDSELDCNDRLLLLEEFEKKAVRRALIEERSRFCLFVKLLRPIIEEEISMISEISNVQEILESLMKLTSDPYDLPVSSESVISHLKLSKHDTLVWNLHTPPSSPSSLGSRKSSMCSISSYNSSSSNSNYGQTNHHSSKYSLRSDFPKNSYEYQSKNSYVTDESTRNKLGHIDSHISNHNLEKKKNVTKISSTNPFLNSYHQLDNDEIFFDKTISSTNSNTYLFASKESDGSITPTNPEQNKNLMNSDLDRISVRSNKPPAPPVRRTSSLSNPNGLATIESLKNCSKKIISKVDAVNKDDEIEKNLSLYDEINVLTKSMNDINFSLNHTDFSDSSFLKTHNDKLLDEREEKSDYLNTRKLFESMKQNNSNIFKSEDESSQLPLPAPPPEAFVESNTSLSLKNSNSSSNHIHSYQQHHYNKITNVHREFLETLNSKLSQSPLSLQNPRVSRRSSKQSISDDFAVSNYSETSGKHRSHSSRSQSASRMSSRKNSMEKNNGSVLESSSFTESFAEKLNQTVLHQKQHSAEIAKAAASNALQRKQSVPDLNEFHLPNKNQNRVNFSSALNLNSTSINQPFQVVEIQTNSTQQPIYASRNQLNLTSPYGGGFMGISSIYNSERSSHQTNGFFNKI